MWNKIKIWVFGILIIIGLLHLWELRHPTPVKCAHVAHTCAGVGHKWETIKETPWGYDTNDSVRVTSGKVVQLKCITCGIHHSQRIPTHYDQFPK